MKGISWTRKQGVGLALAAVLAVLLLAATAFACGQENKRTRTITSPLTGKVYVILEVGDGRQALFEIVDQDMKRVSSDTWGLVNQSGSVKKAADAYNALSPDRDFKMNYSEPLNKNDTREQFTVKGGTK